MRRWWPLLPMLVMAAVPLLTAATAPVVALMATACLLCAAGIGWRVTAPVSAGAAIATIGYALALWSAAAGIGVIGAGVFGLALLFLLEVGEFARRFDGALVAGDVMRAQIAYWLGHALLCAAAIAGLTLAGSLLALAVPGGGRAVIVGIGGVIAFAGALRGGILRRPGSA